MHVLVARTRKQRISVGLQVFSVSGIWVPAGETHVSQLESPGSPLIPQSMSRPCCFQGIPPTVSKTRSLGK